MGLPDPEFWKKAQYSTLWKKHMDNCNALIKKIESRFPKLKNCIKEGHGATTDKWLRFRPDEKAEADLIINNPDDYKPIFHVEVTGSHKINPDERHPIWIRPDKINHTKDIKEKYWFYCVYKDTIKVVDSKIAEKYNTKEKIKEVYIKMGIPERYVEIPVEEAISEEDFFKWIEEEIKNIKCNPYTQQTYFE